MNDEPSVARSRARRRVVSFLLAGALLMVSVPIGLAAAHAVPAAPRVGYAHGPAVTPVVVVNMTDGAPFYSPKAFTVASSSSVDVHLENLLGAQTHTFTLLNQSGVVLNATLSPSQLDRYLATNGTQANVSVAPGGNGWANLTFGASNVTRSFEFLSAVPYQFQAGAWGFLNVSALGPTLNLTDNTTDSFQFQPAILSATPPSPNGSTTIHLVVTNLGNLDHTFTLAAKTNVTVTTAGYFQSNPSLTNITINSGAGTTNSSTFTVLSPGIYEFICTKEGHFQNGMYGYLYVGVPVPPAPPAPSTAVVEVGVLAGAGVLLGIGLLLAVTAGFIGRFPRPPPGHGHS